MVRILILLVMSATFFSTSEGANSKIDQCDANGQHFLIATVRDANPFTVFEYNGTSISHYDGYIHRIVTWMSQKCNFTFKYMEPSDWSYGSFENGSWNGMIGMLLRDEVKLVAIDMTMTYPRSLAVEFTTPISYNSMMFMIPYPELDGTIDRIVKPFQYEVWIYLFCSLIVGAICLGIVSWIESRKFPQHNHRQTGWFPNFWFLFRMMVANPNGELGFTWSLRMMVAAWSLVGIVIVNAYTGSVVSYLMAPRFVPLINNVQDLANSNKIHITVRKSTAQYSVLMDATSGPLAKLGAFLRDHPENLYLPEDTNIEDKVYNLRLAYPVEETFLKGVIYKDFQTTGKCRLFIAKEPFYPNRNAFAVGKSDPFAKILSDQILWLSQVGLLDYWMKFFLPPPHRCSAPLSSTPEKNQKLNLNSFSSAFLLYGVGIVAAIVAFVLECLVSWWKNKIRVKAISTRAHRLVN